MINSKNYITIQGFMVSDLGLKGNELLIYAIIYGFSQAENQMYTGSRQYLAEWTNSTKQGVSKTLKSLVEKGYIEKFDKIVNGVKFCDYRITELTKVVNKVDGGGKQSLSGGGKQRCPHNIDIHNIEHNIDISIMHGATDADTVPEEQPIVKLILNDKSFYNVCQSQIDHWQELYPAANVKQQLLKMKGWLESNPTRRKTKRGINAFITNWLSREQDKGNIVKLPYSTAQNTTGAKDESEKDYLSGW